MINFFSRDILLRKPRLNDLQMPQLLTSLQAIPEEDENCTSATSSCSSPIRRTFSTSYIEVSFSDDEDDLLSPQRRPPLAPLTSNSSDLRLRPTSPTSSTSSSSSGLPPTPTSDDDFPMSHFLSGHAPVKPLNITKNCAKTASFSAQEELSDDDESDFEWYSREFSKIISLNSPLPPLLSQQRPPPPRPESLLIEPILIEELSRNTPSPILVEPKCQHLKRAIALSHKRSRSLPKEIPPPVPPIPMQFLTAAVPSNAQPSQALAAPVRAKPRPRSLSLRRPPPRIGIPDDCLTNDIVTGVDDGSWPSAFDISSYEHPSPAPSSAFIMPSPSSSAPLVGPSAPLSTVPEVLDSPASMYSQTSALPQDEFEDSDALDAFGEIEFAVDDVKFDLNIDLRLPLSLPNSPIDLETDFTNGLEELRRTQEGDSTTLIPPIIAISDADETTGYSPSLSPAPSTATSFDSIDEHAEDVESSARPILSSKWSSSTLGSVREQPALLSFPGASKLRLYLGGGNSPLSKYKQKQQERKQQHRSSAAPFTTAKAAAPRATTDAIFYSSYSDSSPSKTPTAVKKAQRQVVVVEPPSPSFFYYTHTPQTPTTPSTPSTPASPSPFHLKEKNKAVWSRRESDVMIIGYGYGGIGQELERKRSLTPTVGDAESEESFSGRNRRKPIPFPVEMFLRNPNV